MCTTAVSGYTALLHIRLYWIYPVLVVAPTLLLAAVIHFWVQANKRKQKIEFAKVFGDDAIAESNADASLGDNMQSDDRQEAVIDNSRFSNTASTEVLQFGKDDSRDQNIADALKSSQVADEIPKQLNRKQSVIYGIHLANKAEEVLKSSVPEVTPFNEFDEGEFDCSDHFILSDEFCSIHESSNENADKVCLNLEKRADIVLVPQSIKCQEIPSGPDSADDSMNDSCSDSISLSTDFSESFPTLESSDENL
jgi:hypothetical protein